MMLSVRSCSPAEMKILVPVILKLPSACTHRLGAEQAEVGAAMRLGQVHGAGPFAGDHLRHIGLLLLGRAVHQNRRGRAHGEAAIHRERHVGGDLEFVDRLRERHRQALPAIFSRRRQAEPATFGDLLEGVP